jgi:hypothetical protein
MWRRKTTPKMTQENDATAIDELLPDWAVSRANGDYLAIGACLPTRDGRRIGNATVIGLSAAVFDLEVMGAGTIATIIKNPVHVSWHKLDALGQGCFIHQVYLPTF